MKLADNCVTSTKFSIQVKRNVAFAFGGEKPEDENLSNYIDFDSEELEEYYSYFNVPAFGFKTINQDTGGTKNVRGYPHLLGYVAMWVLGKHGGSKKRQLIRRISREVFLKNSRYDVRPADIAYQIRNWQVPPSVHKQFVKILFCFAGQVRCCVVNLVNTGCIDYNTGTMYFEKWPITPNIIDPIMAHYRLGTQKKRG